MRASATAHRIGRNATSRLGAQVASRLTAIVLVALIGRLAGAEALGLYALVTGATAIASTLADLGLTPYLTREIAAATSDDAQATVLADVLTLKLTTAALAAALLIGSGWLWAPAMHGILTLAAIAVIPEAATQTIAAVMNGRQRMEISSGLQVAVRLSALVGTGLALQGHGGLIGVFLALLVAQMLGSVWHWVVLHRWRIIPALWRRRPGWCLHIRQALPFAATNLLASVYSRADLLLIGAWRGSTEAGLYHAAYRLWEAVGLIPASLLDAMYPEMARRAARGDRAAVLSRWLALGWRPLLIAGGTLSAVGIALAPLAIRLVFGDRGYGEAVLPLRVLMASAPAMFLYLLSGHLLYAVGYQTRVTRVMATVAAINLALNLFIIPRFGLMGASVIALASEWLLAGLMCGAAKKTNEARQR